MRHRFAALRRPHQLVSAVLGLSVLAAPLALIAPAQAMAPTGLSVTAPNSSTPVLAWGRVAGATSYKVQIDNNAGFASPEVQQDTRNNRYVPSVHLSRGTQYWRVTAIKDGVSPSWASGTFAVGAVSVPTPTAPANGAVLPQPSSPPLLRWQTSRGATSYTVEVDGDADFIGAKSYTTRTTSVAIPDALPAGDYFWRVTASLGQGLTSVASPTSSFILGALPAPTLTYPVDDINTAVEDVVFDWLPVAGAATYDLQVATDQSFNNFALTATNVYGSRYSPATTLNNDQFWWRVRAVDLAGQPTEWAATQFSFKREWLDTPQPVYPTGSMAVANGSVASSDGAKVFFQWTPVQHATTYELFVSNNAQFDGSGLGNIVRSCTTAATTYVPRSSTDCNFGPDVVTYWQVRPMDQPYPGGLPGILSAPQKVKWAAPADPGPFIDFATVTGLKVAMTGTGAATNGLGCTDVACNGLTTTPVLKWDRMPGIDYYRVHIAVDANFTGSPVPNLPDSVTTNNYFALRANDQKSALADSQAGVPYFWYVVPCDNVAGCGVSPVSKYPPLSGAHSFQKRSPGVTGLTSSNPAGSDLTFSWQDYFDTNQSASALGEVGQQSAKQYRIQVDNEASFSQPLLDEALIDQATYTAFDRLYPEGTLFWRVQAVDAQDNALTWSATASLTKASPSIVQISPVGGVAKAGTVPLEWQPQAFASAYDVEVYANNDWGFSPVNKIFSARVANSASTPTETIPASSSPYLWRVRRLDSRGNVGPWSTAAFISQGAAPELLAPAGGTLQGSTTSFFAWSDVPGGARYQVAMTSDTGGTQNYDTVATAMAPSELATGSYTWQVTAFDSSDKKLGVSATRSFRVDAIAPRVKKIQPKKLKASSDVQVVFSEAVKGITSKTVKLKHGNSRGKYTVVKAKVKSKNGGKVAVINPTGRLKKGTYMVVFKNSAIKDSAGNTLVDKKIAAPSR